MKIGVKRSIIGIANIEPYNVKMNASYPLPSRRS